MTNNDNVGIFTFLMNTTPFHVKIGFTILTAIVAKIVNLYKPVTKLFSILNVAKGDGTPSPLASGNIII
jgi:hypothetical protein